MCFQRGDRRVLADPDKLSGSGVLLLSNQLDSDPILILSQPVSHLAERARIELFKGVEAPHGPASDLGDLEGSSGSYSVAFLLRGLIALTQCRE